MSVTAGKSEVIGLKEFRKELAELDDPKKWNKELGKTQRVIAQKVAGWSRFAASSLGGPFAHFAGSIKGTGGVIGAKIGIAPQANATFWGAKKHTGWYGAGKYTGSTGVQHPKWVGAGWDVGVAGQGPYAINNTIAAKTQQILEDYATAIDRITADAFDN